MLTEFRSLQDVWKKLPTEMDARRFLEDAIWHQGRFCPHCGSFNTGAITGPSARAGLYQCRERVCRSQFTITTRTPLHATKLDLRVWIAAFFLVLTSSKGISSVVLARLLGVSQKTAWKMGHAVREMMNPNGDRSGQRLTGTVEVDEAFIGGKPKYRRGIKNKRGKGTSKPQVLVVVQRGGEARSVLIPDGKTITVKPHVEQWVHPTAILMTDSNRIYRKIGLGFAAHHSVNHSKKIFAHKDTGAHINTAEAFVGQVERALVGVYHLLPRQHLQRYLDEISWRWNRRQQVSKVPGSAGSASGRHQIWRPLPVLAQMIELLRNAPGRQVRRSERFGLAWPAQTVASFGG